MNEDPKSDWEWASNAKRIKNRIKTFIQYFYDFNDVVNELEIHYPTNRIRAATFGRGVWDSPLNSSSTYANSEIVNNLNIYPNPASNQLYVKLKSSDLVHFEIRSISGKIIKEGTLVSNNYIDVSRINSGTYIIKIRVGNSLYRQKISITQNSR